MTKLSREQSSTKLWYQKNSIHILFLIILISVTYINSLDNAFVSDDIAEILQNPDISKFSAVWEVPLGFIRPFLYWIAFHIGGLNPIFFRLINIFFHIGTTITLYILLSTLYNKRLAIFASSLFAIHPLLTEPIIWISGGLYPQYTFFFILSLTAYIFSYRFDNFKLYIASVIFFLLSLMTHPVMPLTLPAVYFLYELVFGNLRKNWKRLLIFFILSIIWIFYVLSGISAREATLQQVHYQEKGVDNIFVIVPVALTNYFQLFIWPKDLTLYHSELFYSGFEFMMRLLISLLYLILIVISFFKHKLIFFWSSLFLIALAPTLSPFRLNWIVAERYVYLSSIGIFVIFSYFLDKISSLKKFKVAIYTLFIFMTLALCVRTYQRNIDWHNEDNLWIATGKTSPSSPNTHNNLGDVYGRWGDKQRSLQEFLYAIKLKPNYADAYHNAGNVYKELGQMDKSLEFYQQAASLNPYLWQSHQNIAAIYYENKQFDKALDYIQKAVQINPTNLHLRNNLGIVYLSLGDKQKAKQEFSLVLSVDPQNPVARAGLMEASK